ncbi:MAG: 16S rRNA (cytidine(1402)-2'-O)-methyltransferase [Chloroflexi bacterium]|nr:16S rRNA (cytidine(1402)-2'-O)-methyltransferase [Chloroflexota bacterium]
MRTLYVVATPIGNLEDITVRAMRVLGEVGLIAAEDTRVTRKLLQRYDIHTPMTSYHEHNKRAKLEMLLNSLQEKDIALVCDAGTPGINDPGSELVEAASEAGATVVPIPGPSALTTAVAASGLPVEQFTYLGFLPRRKVDRKRLLEPLANDQRTLIAFETPHRLRKSLADILDTLGDRTIVVCRELTKLHEEIFRGTVSEAVAHFEAPRGEFTLVIAPAPETGPTYSPDEVRESLDRLRTEGVTARDAVAQLVEQSGMPRRDVYRLWLETQPEKKSHKSSGE